MTIMTMTVIMDDTMYSRMTAFSHRNDVLYSSTFSSSTI